MNKLNDEQIMRFSLEVRKALAELNQRLEILAERVDTGEGSGGSELTMTDEEVYTRVWKDDVENAFTEQGEAIELVNDQVSSLSQSYAGLESIVGEVQTVAGSKSRSLLDRQTSGKTAGWITKDADGLITQSGDEFAFLLPQPARMGADYTEEDLKEGDVWINLDEANKLYVWNGNYFQVAQDGEIDVVRAAASLISQKVDNITLRVIGSDGTVSEIALNDQGQINLLGTVLAQKIMAEDIIATGSFQVNNETMHLIADQAGVHIGPDSWDSEEFRSSLSLGSTYAIFTGAAMLIGTPSRTAQIDINAYSLVNINGNMGLSLSGGSGTVVVQPDMTPIITNTYSLGSASLRWKNVYTNAVDIGGYPAVAGRTKTVTGTTAANGNISLGLGSDYGVLCVQRVGTGSICTAFWSATYSGWWCHVATTAATPAAVANAEVTLKVDYYYKG